MSYPTKITTSTTLTYDNDLYLIDASSGNLTATFPAISFGGSNILLKRIDDTANIVTVETTAPDIFAQFGSSFTLASEEHRHFVSYIDESNNGIWYLTASNTIGPTGPTGPTGPSGLPTFEVSGTGDITTTSTSDVAVTGMTVTPGAGTYLVDFSTSVRNSTADAEIHISVYNNDVKLNHTERRAISTNGSLLATPQDMELATNTVTSVSANQAIDIRWRTTAGTATMHERTLDLVKLS